MKQLCMLVLCALISTSLGCDTEVPENATEGQTPSEPSLHIELTGGSSNGVSIKAIQPVEVRSENYKFKLAPPKRNVAPSTLGTNNQ